MQVKTNLILRDLAYLGSNLREVDLDEVIALGHENPISSVIDCAKSSDVKYGLYIEDELVAACGIASYDGVFGLAWLLCTDDVVKKPIWVFKTVKELLLNHVNDYECLGNIMPEGSSNRKFVEKLGFNFVPDNMEYNNQTFERFFYDHG